MLDIATINTEISHHYSGILNSEFIHRILNSELYSRSIIPIQGNDTTYTYFVYLSFGSNLQGSCSGNALHNTSVCVFS